MAALLWSKPAGPSSVIQTSAELTSVSWSELMARPTCAPTLLTPGSLRSSLLAAAVIRSISGSEVPGTVRSLQQQVVVLQRGQQGPSADLRHDRQGGQGQHRGERPDPARPGDRRGDPAVEEPRYPPAERPVPARALPRSSSVASAGVRVNATRIDASSATA